MKRRFALAVAVLAVALPATALAVWGGTVDTTHPSVGAMYFDFMGNGVAVPDGLVCSGSYAGPSADGKHDVFLTAGHCMPPASLGIPPSALIVSFDGDGTNGVSGQIKVSEYHQMPGFGTTRAISTTWASCCYRRIRSGPASRRCNCRRRAIWIN